MKTDQIQTIFRHKRIKLFFFVILELILISGSLFVGYLFGEKQSVTMQSLSAAKPSPTQITPTGIITPTITLTSTPVAQKSNRMALHVDAIDYSQGHPSGLVTTAKVKLYNMDGNLIEEKTPSPYVQNGPIGTGGDTVFYLLPSTYKVTAETDTTSGECIITVRATTEYNSCAIYLVNK